MWLLGEERCRQTIAPADVGLGVGGPSAGRRALQAETPLVAPDWSSNSPGPRGAAIASHALQQDVEIE